MSKENLVSVLIITMNCFWLGSWIDQRFFLRDKLIKKTFDKAVKKGKCPICERPMKVVFETTAAPESK